MLQPGHTRPRDGGGERTSKNDKTLPSIPGSVRSSTNAQREVCFEVSVPPLRA